MITVEHIPTHTVGQLAKSLMNILKLYTRGGSFVKVILMDKEFDRIKNQVGLLEVNTAVAREQVAKIEQQIRLVKEHT